ncbi:MAG: hypothetical protein ACRCVU_02635, partial [Flavobacterium sp.]
MKKVRRNCHQVCLIVASMFLLQSSSLFASSTTSVVSESISTNSVSSYRENSTSIIKGKVIDNYGLPLPGAIVQLVGTKEIASTDLDGVFTLSVSDSF